MRRKGSHKLDPTRLLRGASETMGECLLETTTTKNWILSSRLSVLRGNNHFRSKFKQYHPARSSLCRCRSSLLCLPVVASPSRNNRNSYLPSSTKTKTTPHERNWWFCVLEKPCALTTTITENTRTHTHIARTSAGLSWYSRVCVCFFLVETILHDNYRKDYHTCQEKSNQTTRH